MAEAAYADALGRIKAAAAKAAAGEAADPAAVQKARLDLAAAKKRLGKKKKGRPTERPGTSPPSSRAVGSAPHQPARLPGFGSQEYWDAQPDNPAWQHYPAPRTIPTEAAPTAAGADGGGRPAGDAGVTKSFAVEDRVGAQRFWEEWGFVIFHDVLTEEECGATVSEMWTTLEGDHPGESTAGGAHRASLSCRRATPRRAHALPVGAVT